MVVDSAIDLLKHARDMRDMWQGRVLAAARGRMMIAISSILAHSFPDAMPVLFAVVRPSCWDAAKQSIRTPFLCSAGKISKGGQIVADAIMADGHLPVSKVMFANTRDFEYELRKLADELKLSDADRIALIDAAKRWVVCDYRLDPTMDPRDPDAKRLVH